MSATDSTRLHRGLAEQGKLHALAGRHSRALAYYREAMRLAVERGEPAIYPRHYLECSLESLEAMGSYGEVAECCERMIAEHGEGRRLSGGEEGEGGGEGGDWVRRDLAHLHQRLGVARLKGEARDDARESLARALALADAKALPLAATLLRWIDGGLHINEERIAAEQRRRGYYTVRADRVERGLALRLPELERGPNGNGRDAHGLV